ncbi:MAG: ABC transporter permease subunit [Bacillota bacterium]|jgi:ABC-type transport system involved in multi-copper enzyme maturation permease subunit
MELFKYEMKKLLFNKNKLILLAILFAVYATVGFSLATGEFELDSSEQSKQAIQEYKHLLSQNSGTFDALQYAESKAIYEAAVAQFGTGEPLAIQINRNPILKFHFRYNSFGERVNTYWNGPEKQNSEDILGVYPIQDKLKELEEANQTDSYEYQYYRERLDTEYCQGEPYFEHAFFWNTLFVMFEGIMVIFLFMMVLIFYISPLFTQEVKTEMDSIILCSAKGRREIVTSKLLSAALASIIISVVYLIAFFVGIWLGYGDLSGIDAPLRSLGGFGFSALNMTIGGTALFAAGWLIFVAVIFGLALSLISALVKDQSVALGIGIVVLLAGAMSNYLGESLRRLAWPFVDFNFGTMPMFNEIFGGYKMYNVLGMPASYGTLAFVICIILGIIAALLTYLAQKKRSVI